MNKLEVLSVIFLALYGCLLSAIIVIYSIIFVKKRKQKMMLNKLPQVAKKESIHTKMRWNEDKERDALNSFTQYVTDVLGSGKYLLDDDETTSTNPDILPSESTLHLTYIRRDYDATLEENHPKNQEDKQDKNK